MENLLMQKILSIVATILGLMSSLTQPVQTPMPTVSTDPFLPKTSFVQEAGNSMHFGATFNPTSGGTYRLQSSTGLSDTSITLSSFKEPISGIKYTMSYINTAIVYGTLDPSNATNKELISFTGITQNSDNSATLTGVSRGLGFSYPFTASTTLQKTHSGQSIFIMSDAPQVFNTYANKNNDETILGAWLVPTPLVATQIANKAYVDGTAFQGAATSSEIAMGIVVLSNNAITAAGTASTSSGAPYVIANKVATSTYNGLYNNNVVVTKTNSGAINTIDPNFIATSSNYTWSGLNTFTGTGTTTFSASTSMASINLVNPPTGNLSRLLLATTTATNIGTASTTVFTVTVPANTLYNGYNGVVRTRLSLSAFSLSTNDTWQLEAIYGGTSVCCTATSTISPHDVNNGGTTFNGGGGFIDVDLYGNNSNNSQQIFISPSLNAVGTTNNASAVYSFILPPKTGVTSVDSTIPQTLVIKARAFQGSTNTVSQVSSFLMR